MRTRFHTALPVVVLVAGCASAPKPPPPPAAPSLPPQRIEPIAKRPAEPPREAPEPAPSRRPGAYYLDDGPHDNPPPDLDKIPDAEPRAEPLHRFANNPYTALGQEFVPDKNLRPYRNRGLASWYGKRFHGAKTASGEVYDMYQMTAAHPTLPIPSYAKVTSVASGRSVVVRINDRGPFLRGRIIDLSYAAAAKLGYISQGSTLVEVESIHPADGSTLAATATPTLRTIGDVASSPPRSVGYPLVQEPDGIFVQLGAFSSVDNAEGLRSRVRPLMLLESKRLVVMLREGLHRVWAGPYSNRADALSAALRVATDLREAN